jgi:hypothetical protein
MANEPKQDLKQTIRSGAELAYQLLLRERARGPRDRLAASERPIVLGPRPVRTIVAAAMVIGAGVLVFLVVIAAGLKVLEYGVEPVVDYASGPIFRALLTPGVLPALAVAVLLIGLPFALKTDEPAQFIAGLVCVALGLVCFWQLPRLIGLLPTRSALKELEGFLLIGAILLSGFLFFGGVLLIAGCEWTREAGDGNVDE